MIVLLAQMNELLASQCTGKEVVNVKEDYLKSLFLSSLGYKGVVVVVVEFTVLTDARLRLFKYFFGKLFF